MTTRRNMIMGAAAAAAAGALPISNAEVFGRDYGHDGIDLEKVVERSPDATVVTKIYKVVGLFDQDTETMRGMRFPSEESVAVHLSALKDIKALEAESNYQGYMSRHMQIFVTRDEAKNYPLGAEVALSIAV